MAYSSVRYWTKPKAAVHVGHAPCKQIIQTEQMEALMITFTFTADNGADLGALIQEAWFDVPPPSGVNSREFPPGPWSELMGPTDAVAVVFRALKYITTQELGDVLRQRGLRVATVRELLCFAAAFPDEQRKRGDIVALGSLYKGCYAPALIGNERFRSMRLVAPHYGSWEPTLAFLCIQERQ